MTLDELHRRQKGLERLEKNWVEGAHPNIDGPTCRSLNGQLQELIDTFTEIQFGLELFDQKILEYTKEKEHHLLRRPRPQ